MHELIPHSGWKARYQASLDPKCPLYLDRGAPENGAYHRMYDFVIHPEWDAIGCETLYIKLLFVDYDQGYAVIELLGEWNDAVHNDVMEVKRRLADPLNLQGIMDDILALAIINFASRCQPQSSRSAIEQPYSQAFFKLAYLIADIRFAMIQ